LILPEIATVLNTESPKLPPVSPDAVNNKGKRIGLPKRPSTKGRPKAITKAKLRHISQSGGGFAALHTGTPAAPALDLFQNDTFANGKRLLDLTMDDCHWPSGSGDAILFCGAPVETGKPYCPCHCRRSYGRVQFTAKEIEALPI
jgi:hypothetical protein